MEWFNCLLIYLIKELRSKLTSYLISSLLLEENRNEQDYEVEVYPLRKTETAWKQYKACDF